MKNVITGLFVGLLAVLAFNFCLLAQDAAKPAVVPADKPLIQMAILLDTSNSMDGLIAQAKTQLWSIVNEFALSSRDGRKPELQVALYQYGNDGLSASENWIQQVVGLSGDLDTISEKLFALRTNGGTETCGAAIKHAVENLQWSGSNKDYKVIFIAGNEPFTQGRVNYQDACKLAISKGIVVNTIHCGDEKTGIKGMWKDGADLADGAYFSIDQNAAVVHVIAPQDKELAELGAKINETYIAYGKLGASGAGNQAKQDANAGAGQPGTPAPMADRALAKSSSMYKNSAWDVVDAVKDGKDLKDIKEEELPEDMKKMTLEERKAYVESKAKERTEIQEKIKRLGAERAKYIAEESKRQSDDKNTLGKAINESVRGQLQRAKFTIESPATQPSTQPSDK